MSNLQISLAVLGVVLLALIVAYNAWTARRNAPRRAEPEEESTDPQRLEPGMNTVGHGADLTKYQHEPVLGDFGNAIPGTEPLQMPESAGALPKPMPSWPDLWRAKPMKKHSARKLWLPHSRKPSLPKPGTPGRCKRRPLSARMPPLLP